MERECVNDPMIFDGNGDAAGSVFPDIEALAEVILLSPIQEMVIQDTAAAESIDRLIRENQKQLAPKMLGSSVADSGQSSSSSSTPVDNEDEFYCAICIETVPGILDLKFAISLCRHVFCLSCIVQYVAAKMDDRIKCPRPQLRGCRR